MKPIILPMLPEKWWYPPAQVHTSFAGKTVIVTGSSSALGFEAAAKFVSLGASHVILAVRNIAKGEAARRKIEERTKKIGLLDVWEVDMANFKSIQSFAERATKELPRLDVLLLNAGMATGKHVIGVEGWESTLQVNVLGTALLGLLLLPKLKSSKTSARDTPHLVIVTSDSQRWVRPSDIPDPTSYDSNMLQALNSSKAYSGVVQYARSKLLAMYVVQGLGKLMTAPDGSPETIVTGCCPGACTSDLQREQTALPARIGFYIFGMVAQKTAEQGSRTLVSAATLGEEAQGAWWKNDTLLR